MDDSINIQIRKKLGENLKKIITERANETSLRQIDAKTNKDHSWLGKIFRGEQNLTIDSLTEIIREYKIQPKELFNFTIKFPDE